MSFRLLTLALLLSISTSADSLWAQQSGTTPGPFDQQAASIQALTIVGQDVVYAGSFGLGMFRSDDRGATWTKSGEGVTDPFILSLVTGKDGSVYVGTFRGGVFRSKDQGKSWQVLNGGLKRKEIKTLLAVGDVIYAGTADGAYRLNTADDRWSVVTTGLDEVLVHALAQGADGTLYAGTSGKGVLRFKANTTGWVRMQHGLKDHEGMIENFIRVLTIDPEGGIYAGTFDGGVFRSTDGGQTWRPISRALPNDSIRGIVFNSRGLFVATGHGIFKTTDKGRQWVPLNNGLTSMAVQVLIESGTGSLYAGTNAGAFRSDDDGKSWTAINQGLEGGVAPPPFLFR
ncbi:MAG TPA: YCF48-related protein [Nitrospira sp.]|nr:YCF48-related protein [Nitrospira sp.]